MKRIFLWAVCALPIAAFSQNLQLHYDMRHTIDPELNPENFPSLSFEYFKLLDTVKTGSFLLKLQSDFKGKKKNMAQVFVQLSHSIKFWKAPVYMHFNYSGGLGATDGNFGFYIPSSYGVGVSYPFQWKGGFFATNLILRYNSFEAPSYDPQFTFYFGRGIKNYKFFTAGSFVFWTENRNRGDDQTKNLSGKKFAFFGDPQIWVNFKNGISAGTRINVFYHLLTERDRVQYYPTIGLKYQFL